MAAKVTEVALERVCDGEATAFEISHAERLLAMRDSGWRLPDDSDYELNTDGTIGRRDKKKGK